LEGLTVDACDHVGAVCCALQGVAVDPSCLAGGDVRGKAEAGGEALSHGLSVGCFFEESTGWRGL